MNRHIESMKNAITNYRKTVRAAAAKIEENTRLYRPEEAEKANTAILGKLKEDRDAVKGIISEAHDAGLKDAEAWGQLDGSKITDDKKLLDAGIINPNQFRDLVQKYQNNSTMLQILAKYAEEHNKESHSFSAIWDFGGKGNAARASQHFDATGIPTVKSRQAIIDRAAAQATGMIDRISDLTPGKMGCGPDSAFLDTELEKFGAET